MWKGSRTSEAMASSAHMRILLCISGRRRARLAYAPVVVALHLVRIEDLARHDELAHIGNLIVDDCDVVWSVRHKLVYLNKVFLESC